MIAKPYKHKGEQQLAFRMRTVIIDNSQPWTNIHQPVHYAMGGVADDIEFAPVLRSGEDGMVLQGLKHPYQ